MIRERLARGAFAGKGRHAGGLGGCLFGGQLVLTGAGLQLLQFQLQLIQQPRLAFRPLTIEFPLEILDQQFQGGDLGLIVGAFRQFPGQPGLGGSGLRLCCTQRNEVIGRGIHRPDYTKNPAEILDFSKGLYVLS